MFSFLVDIIYSNSKEGKEYKNWLQKTKERVHKIKMEDLVFNSPTFYYRNK